MITSTGYWLAFVLSLAVHELGHLLVARVFGLRVKKVGFSWRGPYIIRQKGSPLENAIVSAAGPLFNLACAAAALHSWQWLAIFNIVLGLSNLVPTRNSDGGRILREIGLLKSAKPEMTPVDAAAPGLD